jgi:hypothetical protein
LRLPFPRLLSSIDLRFLLSLASRSSSVSISALIVLIFLNVSSAIINSSPVQPRTRSAPKFDSIPPEITANDGRKADCVIKAPSYKSFIGTIPYCLGSILRLNFGSSDFKINEICRNIANDCCYEGRVDSIMKMKLSGKRFEDRNKIELKAPLNFLVMLQIF